MTQDTSTVEQAREDATLISNLRLEARQQSEAHRMMADAKTARQTDRGDEPGLSGVGYSYLKPEQTTAWKAADRIAALAKPVASPDAGRITFGPCQHQWAYAPTVGNISCMLCKERREHDHPDTIKYLKDRDAAYASPDVLCDLCQGEGVVTSAGGHEQRCPDCYTETLPASPDALVERIRAQAFEEAAKVADVIAKECRRDELRADEPESQGLAAGGNIEAKRIAKAIRALSPRPVDEVREALRAAKQFIENGIDLGYIRMPDPGTPDSAFNTLPLISQALASLEGVSDGQG